MHRVVCARHPNQNPKPAVVFWHKERCFFCQEMLRGVLLACVATGVWQVVVAGASGARYREALTHDERWRLRKSSRGLRRYTDVSFFRDFSPVAPSNEKHELTKVPFLIQFSFVSHSLRRRRLRWRRRWTLTRRSATCAGCTCPLTRCAAEADERTSPRKRAARVGM